MSHEIPDIRTAWADACADFKRATRYDFESAPNEKGGDDIVGKFITAKAKDAEAHQKMDKVKNIVGKMVVAVERLGTIAAQGASMVFGSPANITMNCISFFIDAGFKYKDIAHNIARNIDDLFSRIVTILERFQIYRDYEQIMMPPMIRVAHRLLISVVEICGLCFKIRNRNKLKKWACKTLFSDDGGIQEKLAVLETLEKDELQMKSTLTLAAAETNQRTIVSGFANVEAKNTKMMDYVKKMNETSTDQKILSELKEISVHDSASKGEYQSNCDKIVSGSCSWLKTDAQYQSWSDAAKENESLLVLQGVEGCGKSYSFTAVLRDLLARYPQYQDDATRVSVA